MDMLVVASKIKAYTKEKHEMSIGKEAMERLSQIVASAVDEAAQAAKIDKRVTIKMRDIMVSK